MALGVGLLLTIATPAVPVSAAAHSARTGGSKGDRAPSGPSLTAGGPPAVTETDADSVQPEQDPLVANGLTSPLCSGILGAGELGSGSRTNCETSGFVAAPAPTGDYAIDVHIDTGVLGLSSGGLLSAVQDLFVSPVWMALVWAMHALVVMLEWCFTVDLIDSPAARGVGADLRGMQASFTAPWLVLALAVASVLALYDGLVRRNVVDTVGQALVMAAMMAGGLWVIADPAGTVGALGSWANQASLGTLAVADRGSPSEARSALADSLDTLFAVAVEAPWCYLEFGDVTWCRDRADLEARVRAAGLRIADEELASIACEPGALQQSACVDAGSSQARSLEQSAALLRAARSNGGVFVALPANGPARNSINETGSLLRTICGSSEATRCHGPAAAEAEFRTNAGTWPRVGGLLLIAAGFLGMLLLLGFLALRLLSAAILSLLYLLLAPAMVLAPALGETGRALFRRWAGQLLGAVVSKLLFSFLLGAVLGVLGILARLEGLGWWTQWLLMSALWWGAFLHRHEALRLADTRRRPGVGGGSPGSVARGVRHRLGSTLASPRRVAGAGRWAANKLGGSGQEVRGPRRPWVASRRSGASVADGQVARLLEARRRDVMARADADRSLLRGRAQAARVEEGRRAAAALGDRRRMLELEQRGRRIQAEIAQNEALLWHKGAQDEASCERFLDEQRALPGALASTAGGERSRRRDYAALTGLVGLHRHEYDCLEPREQRAMRLKIDRELARRVLPPWYVQDGEPPASDRELGPTPDELAAEESAVMRDARAVAEGRKRELGLDRP